jgi:hypothetical protein
MKLIVHRPRRERKREDKRPRYAFDFTLLKLSIPLLHLLQPCFFDVRIGKPERIFLQR